MRRYIYLFAMLTLFVIGCSEESNMLSPVNNISSSEPNWIALPQAEGLSVNTTFSTSREIEGDEGGSLYISKRYTSASGEVTIYAKAYFPEDSFHGDKYITMTVDDQTCTATFSPHMVFEEPVKYSATFTGVDLTGVNPSNIKFAYLATDGSVEYALHEGLTVDVQNKKISVKNAKLPHFSRYGFVNKTY